MSSNGWIKLHRKLTDSWIWKDPEKLRAWIDILLMVNHEDKKIEFNGRMVMVERGSRFTSIEKLAARWGWNRKRVMRFLGQLESADMVTTKRTPSGTTIKVRNYGKYQGFETSRGTTKGTTDGTAYGTTGGTQTRMIKNDKESIRTRARARASTKPPERTYEMDELELKLLATNKNV